MNERKLSSCTLNKGSSTISCSYIKLRYNKPEKELRLALDYGTTIHNMSYYTDCFIIS